uniref:Uncharacterized protein n=1 Tax=Rhipicephalus zambeziensis TaxID=60191 RepID=A0A224Y7G4_9ACAR
MKPALQEKQDYIDASYRLFAVTATWQHLPKCNLPTQSSIFFGDQQARKSLDEHYKAEGHCESEEQGSSINDELCCRTSERQSTFNTETALSLGDYSLGALVVDPGNNGECHSNYSEVVFPESSDAPYAPVAGTLGLDDGRTNSSPKQRMIPGENGEGKDSSVLLRQREASPELYNLASRKHSHERERNSCPKNKVYKGVTDGGHRYLSVKAADSPSVLSCKAATASSGTPHTPPPDLPTQCCGLPPGGNRMCLHRRARLEHLHAAGHVAGFASCNWKVVERARLQKLSILRHMCVSLVSFSPTQGNHAFRFVWDAIT